MEGKGSPSALGGSFNQIRAIEEEKKREEMWSVLWTSIAQPFGYIAGPKANAWPFSITPSHTHTIHEDTTSYDTKRTQMWEKLILSEWRPSIWMESTRADKTQWKKVQSHYYLFLLSKILRVTRENRYEDLALIYFN